jgi:hypothetical protein
LHNLFTATLGRSRPVPLDQTQAVSTKREKVAAQKSKAETHPRSGPPLYLKKLQLRRDLIRRRFHF